MSAPVFDAEAYARSMLAVLGLEAEPAWLPGIVMNLQRTEELARLVLEFPLEDGEEPAPVYTP